MAPPPWLPEEYVEHLVSAAKDDYLGLWEVPALLRETGMEVAEDRRKLSLALVRELVFKHGMVPGSLTKDGGFRPWSTDPEASIVRIERDWARLGRDPNMDYACWFLLPSPTR